MAPRTAWNGGGGSSTVRRSRTLQAKCVENQALVDQLASKREGLGPGNNFAFTLKKAMDSLIAEKVPVTSYEQAIALKGIGQVVGKILFPVPKGAKPKAAAKKKGGRKKKKSPLEDSSNAASSSSSSEYGSPASSAAAAAATGPSQAAANLKRRPDKAHLEALAEKSLHQKAQPLSKKEKAYNKAVEQAENYKGQNLLWQLVLLIDKREKQCDHYSSKVEQCGIPTEIRTLPIGDMAWMAQGRQRTSAGGSGGQGQVVAELMLGTIVERKEIADLVSSLFGTRYNEQQLRLKASGLPQVIFLIEGDVKRDVGHRFSADALNSTMWAIRIEKQNQVVHTAHMEDTVHTLRLMHRRILKRTFPSAFYDEALPAFSEPTAGGRQQPRQRDSFGEQHSRRRRRRLESLHGLVFDQEPVPMAGMPRFISYTELCAKVERDRERGTRTIGSIHQAMLKQVETIGNKKITAIARQYPTPHSLLQAYENVGNNLKARQTCMANLPLEEEGAGMDNPDVVTAKNKVKVLGEKSAAFLSIAYGVDESNDRRHSVEPNNNNDESRQSAFDNNLAAAQARTEKQARANLTSSAAAATTSLTTASAATKKRSTSAVAATASATTTSAATASMPTAADKRAMMAAAAMSRAQASSGAFGTAHISTASTKHRNDTSSAMDVDGQEAYDLERAIAASLTESTTTTTTTSRKPAPPPPARSTASTTAASAKTTKPSNARRQELVDMLSSSSEDDEEATKKPSVAQKKPAAMPKKRRMSSLLSEESLFSSPSPPPPRKKRPSTESNSNNSNGDSNKANSAEDRPQNSRSQAAERLLDSSSSEDDDDDEFAALLSKTCAPSRAAAGGTAAGTTSNAGSKPQSKQQASGSGTTKQKPKEQPQEIIEID